LLSLLLLLKLKTKIKRCIGNTAIVIWKSN
jgi:hypothetical protein